MDLGFTIPKNNQKAMHNFSRGPKRSKTRTKTMAQKGLENRMSSIIYQVLQVVTSFGPHSRDLFRAENVTSFWGINPGHFEEAGSWWLSHQFEKYVFGSSLRHFCNYRGENKRSVLKPPS